MEVLHSSLMTLALLQTEVGNSYLLKATLSALGVFIIQFWMTGVEKLEETVQPFNLIILDPRQIEFGR